MTFPNDRMADITPTSEHVVFEREPEFELSAADGAAVGAVVDVPVPVGQNVGLQPGLVRGESDREGGGVNHCSPA